MDYYFEMSYWQSQPIYPRGANWILTFLSLGDPATPGGIENLA